VQPLASSSFRCCCWSPHAGTSNEAEPIIDAQPPVAAPPSDDADPIVDAQRPLSAFLDENAQDGGIGAILQGGDPAVLGSLLDRVEAGGILHLQTVRFTLGGGHGVLIGDFWMLVRPRPSGFNLGPDVILLSRDADLHVLSSVSALSDVVLRHGDRRLQLSQPPQPFAPGGGYITRFNPNKAPFSPQQRAFFMPEEQGGGVPPHDMSKAGRVGERWLMAVH
jgi:hypothetical protein